MRLPLILFLSAALAVGQNLQGFNYGATYTDGSGITEPGYEALFNAAKNLQGNSNAFTSARLFTSVQAGSTNAPSEAFQAAVNTKTKLLLGLWGSAGQANIDNEVAAIQTAINNLGSSFTDLVVGISVGSEDLYRISPTGIENNSGIGAGPSEIAGYIANVRQALSGGPLKSAPIGHVDTWTAWVNGSNSAVIEASSFIGFDAYPYFQFQNENGIDNAESLFFSAYDQTVAAVGGKPIWVTETGWPVSGETERLAEPSLANAKRYWDQVGCGRLFGKVNTFCKLFFTLARTNVSCLTCLQGSHSRTHTQPLRAQVLELLARGQAAPMYQLRDCSISAARGLLMMLQAAASLLQPTPVLRRQPLVAPVRATQAMLAARQLKVQPVTGMLELQQRNRHPQRPCQQL